MQSREQIHTKVFPAFVHGNVYKFGCVGCLAKEVEYFNLILKMRDLKLLIVICSSFILVGKGAVPDHYPDCTCDGTQYIIEAGTFTSHPCGVAAMCYYDIRFYLSHMPSIPTTTTSQLKTITEYEDGMMNIMSKYGYPLNASIEPMLPDCKKWIIECAEQKRVLVKEECDRFRPLKVDEWVPLQEKGPWKGPQFFDISRFKSPKDEMYFSWWRMFSDGWDGSSPFPHFKYKPMPVDKRFYWGACPYWIIRPTFTMSYLLAEFAGVAFHEDFAVNVIARLLTPYVVRALHCDVFSNRYDDLYLVYNKTQFCRNWNESGTYVCLNLNEAIDKKERNILTECNAPVIPRRNFLFVDDREKLVEMGDIPPDPHWFYPSYPDYPETKWTPIHASFPWFPPYEEHGVQD